MSTHDPSEPLTGTFAVPGGQAQIYERVAIITGAVGEVVVQFAFPSIGVPNIATGDAARASVLEPGAITFKIGGYPLDALMATIRAVFADRIALLPTGQPPSPVAIELGTPVKVAPAQSGVQATHGVPASAALQERQLYDIAVRRDDGTWKAVAPHAVYYRSAWHDFGIAHVTDIHVARRIDFFPGRLEAAGKSDAARNMSNWNDHFRGFVRYANYLHGIGVLDVILATGDVIDYLFEDDDEQSAGGNALFLRNLLLGRSASDHFPEVEELRVPIFIVGGNHDYRMFPHHLVFNLDLGPVSKLVEQYSGYRLNRQEALIACGDDTIPQPGVDRAALSVLIDHKRRSFRAHLADKPYYLVRLGAHRIVMLDSGRDTDLPQSKLDLVRYYFGGGPEGIRIAIDGSPNSVGVQAEMLKLVVDTLNEPGEGLFIVGLHAPLFNMWEGAYPYFFRETQRESHAGQVYGWLARHGDDVSPNPASTARERHPLWFSSGADPDAVSYVKRGDPRDLLDYGVSIGAAHNVLRAVAGIGQNGRQNPRADVVLHGHIHRFNEFRLGEVNGELAYYMDFYTRNPARYYPTRFTTGWASGPGVSIPKTAVTYVEVADDAPPNNEPSEMPPQLAAGADVKYMVTVPPYPKPLSSAPDPRAWWAEHRPLVLQTEALGPFKDGEANLGGFRVLSVKNDVIERIHFVSIEKLHAANYRMDWEAAIAPEPQRAFIHSQRSKEFGGSPAAGDPCGYVLPGTGIQNIVYGDAQGRLFEIWRDAAGKRGSGNLTAAASAPNAAGDASGNPSCYLDTATGMIIVPYRGADGHVHSLYWSTGSVGHDALSGSINAPRSRGTPAGYYTPATTVHHVFYRSDNDHLHALWWTGQDGVSHSDMTADAGAVGARGDPAPYLDTRRGTNIVAFRGVDNHIRSIYWSNGPFAQDDLSGHAGAPPADGDPVAYYLASHDMHQVVYRSGNGHLHELLWVGEAPVASSDLTAAAGAPPAAAGKPAAWYNPAGGKKHVVYRGADGHVHDLSWAPGGSPVHLDLSIASHGPPAAGAPFGFAGPTHQHVIYRGTDNQIHELRWAESGPDLRIFTANVPLEATLQPSRRTPALSLNLKTSPPLAGAAARATTETAP